MTRQRASSGMPFGAGWVLFVTFGLILASELAGGEGVRLIFALVFYGTCPGMLIVDWIDDPTLADRISFAVGGSLAVNILITTLLLGTGTYSASTTFTIVAALSISGAIYNSYLPVDDPDQLLDLRSVG